MNRDKMIHALKGVRIQFDEPLMNVTFTKTGGPADALVFPKGRDEVIQVVNYCRKNNIPWMVLGNASNLIVRDGGIRGVVILLEKMNQISIEGEQLIVQAGAKLIDVSEKALDQQLSGLEFACGIPGSVGGAVYMNAGAYGGEVKDVFTSAELVLPDGTIQIVSANEMDFSYRHSILQSMNCIVLTVTFSLEKGNEKAIKSRMAEWTELRQAKQPLDYPSCGSVFKRPEGHFTGKLIQEANLQGLIWGGAQISTKHAGFIVNINQATATNYIELIAYIQKVVMERFNVSLETEVKIIGEEQP